MYKTGLPGMLLFIGVVVSWWRAVRPQQRTLVLSADNAIWFGTTVGISAALVSGLFDHYFSFTQVLIALFWLMLGLSLHEASASNTTPRRPSGSSPMKHRLFHSRNLRLALPEYAEKMGVSVQELSEAYDWMLANDVCFEQPLKGDTLCFISYLNIEPRIEHSLARRFYALLGREVKGR